ncbi:hypothetical protein [Sporosarcina sp. Te-1]|uniref:hypothetical protein n=1 Tax=Sporosarcina sp. Te-1 TaxID=2818390 RepID=UPI001A9FEB1A|nr:hypothetical protein [Sporosarcina sp. Te-1]QTD42363.1 hypothetical protein J3U78_05980 [Sporosarcina sp. Te-1]
MIKEKKRKCPFSVKSGEGRLASTGAGRLSPPRPTALSALADRVRRRAWMKGAFSLTSKTEATREAGPRSWMRLKRRRLDQPRQA